MPNFTSSFISTANIGQWDYYIFSDNTAIWRSLNGLAAWFNGSGGLIQGAAWLGALIVLSMFLFGAATKNSKVGAGTLGVWFFFMSMMGITGQSNVYNIYTNQVTVVNNVPALALVPASIFSKAGFRVFTSMETAFQSATGSYMSVSRYSFVGPLDLLLSLRSPRMSAATPALSQTLAQVVHDCAVDPNAITAAPPLSKDLDMLNWLTIYGRSSGLTRVFTETDSSGAGIVVACKNGPGDPQVNIGGTLYSGALDYVNRRYEVLATGTSDLMGMVNAETTKRNPLHPRGLWNATSLQDSYNMLIGSAVGMTQSATQFTKNALVASTVTNTLDCMSQSGAMTTPDSCAAGALALGDSMEKWKTDAAMAGSGFLKTMFTSMGVLQALFFALFPIIAIYGLVVPHKTGVVFGGFVFFGIWCQSWLLTVAPIQSYIQSNIVDEMGKVLADGGGMTLANSMAAYQLLSTKLAIASDIMASSQMLSLALLSGSMVALSGVAQKWSAEKHMDPSKLQQDVSKSGPLADIKTDNKVSGIVNNNGESSYLRDRAGSGSYSLQSSFIQNATKGRSQDTTMSKDQSRQKEVAFQKQLMDSTGITHDQAASVSKSLRTQDAFQTQVGAGIAKALGSSVASALTKLKGAPLTKADDALVNKTVASAQEKAVVELAAKDVGFIDKLMGKAGKEVQAVAAGNVMDVAGGMLTVGAMAATLLTGVGAPAAPAAGLAIQGAKEAGKRSLMAKIRGSGVDASKDAVLAGAAKGPGVAGFAASFANGLDAKYMASIMSEVTRNSSEGVKKAQEKKSTFTASDADKLATSWRASTSESSSRSDSDGQTFTAAVVLDKENVRRAGIEGMNGLSGEQLQTRAQTTNAMLRSMSPAADVAAADRQVAHATQGRTAADFGGGSKGQALANFEKNVLFEHFLTGQVSGSMMNTERHDPLGGVVGVQHTPAVEGTKGRWVAVPKGQPGHKENSTALRHWDNGNAKDVAAAGKAGFRWQAPTQGRASSDVLMPTDAQRPVNAAVPTGGVGAKVGSSPEFGGAQDLMNQHGAQHQREFDTRATAEQDLRRQAPGAVAAADKDLVESQIKTGAIATAAVIANGAAGVMGALGSGGGRGQRNGGPQSNTPENKPSSTRSGRTRK